MLMEKKPPYSADTIARVGVGTGRFGLDSDSRIRLAAEALAMSDCPECEKLERKYQLTIGEIYSVVGGKFNTVGEKLRELFRWQDMRDKTLKTLYAHKKTHAWGASGSRKIG